MLFTQKKTRKEIIEMVKILIICNNMMNIILENLKVENMREKVTIFFLMVTNILENLKMVYHTEMALLLF